VRRLAKVCLISGLAACSLLIACGPEGPAPKADEGAPWLREVAAEWGLDFEHSAGSERRFLFPEILSGGVALFDYDQDGWLDVYLVQGGDGLVERGAATGANRLYRNLGAERSGAVRFEDVTEQSGTGDTGYGMGAACGDIDGDGDIDLYVTNVGPNALYRNDGNGHFTEIGAAAGVDHGAWGTSAAFLDYDGDGLLDLFVVNYVDWSPDGERECFSSSRDRVRSYCSPTVYGAPAQDVFYRNRGDGTFEDVTEACGIGSAWGNGLGIAWGDFDGDSRPDIYVANDGTANNLWIQGADGRFEDRALFLGCAVGGQGQAEAGMGVVAADLEGDGDLDILLAHLRGEPNTVYLQQDGQFMERTGAVGLGASSRPFTSFGLLLVDLDGDGYRDIYAANGNVLREDPFHSPGRPYAEPNQIFKGSAEGRFKELSPAGGTEFERVEVSRAAAAGDLDGDGDVDLVVVNMNAPPDVLENVIGQDRSWLGLRVLDARGADAYGARVHVVGAQTNLRRRVQIAYSFQASNDARLQIGLGDETDPVQVSVRWPSGDEQAFGPLKLDTYHVLREQNRPLGGEK
jgi:hypothetical protein